jgi:hypothetical protein
MANFTITDKDVSTIHNSFLYLRNALEHATDTLNPNSHIIRSLEECVKYLKPLRDELVGKQDEIWNKQHNYFRDVQQNNNFLSIWSIYTYDDFKFEEKHNLPVGAEFVCWDVPEADARFKLEGDTWFDVWKCVDRYLDYYSDYVGDHLFVEGFSVEHKNQKAYIKVILGS